MNSQTTMLTDYILSYPTRQTLPSRSRLPPPRAVGGLAGSPCDEARCTPPPHRPANTPAATTPTELQRAKPRNGIEPRKAYSFIPSWCSSTDPAPSDHRTTSVLADMLAVPVPAARQGHPLARSRGMALRKLALTKNGHQRPLHPMLLAGLLRHPSSMSA